MQKKKSTESKFIDTLRKYINIRGLDIIVYLESGEEIELHKNRTLLGDEIIIINKNRETRIPLADIKSIDLFAA
jgi:hypothetical protein